jgi:hypothetical protein
MIHISTNLEHKNKKTHTHTHTRIYIYIERERERKECTQEFLKGWAMYHQFHCAKQVLQQ